MHSRLEVRSITSRFTRPALAYPQVPDGAPRSAALPGPGHRAPATARHRSFDPAVVGRLEAAAWVAYYRREWAAFLRLALTLSRGVLRLPWPVTLRSAWLVLRAVRLWAPLPDNDPARARRAMASVYRLVGAYGGESFDPAVAAALELEWWHVHRVGQYGGGGDRAERALIDALARLYSHVYAVPEASVAPAAHRRASAMALSDRWVSDGCRVDSPLVDRVRDELIASYAALAAAVDAG
jgi:hypothetical protein